MPTVSNHPKRSSRSGAGYNPAPAEVVAARAGANHTQAEAAATVYVNLRTWAAWESTDAVDGRRMPPGLWELYLIKTGQLQLLKKSD